MPILQFKGKTAIETYHHTVPHHALEFDERLSVLGKGEKPSLDGNLIIEGDNLLALKALLPTHAGKVKCIYIDPPYNTGDEGWVYNDNLSQPQFKEWIGQIVGKEEEDACRHDKWCCMMYPRLQLLKSLLRDDGAIFISIDDNEFENLRLLMDEIFGEGSFVATIIWQKKYSRDNRPPIGTVHDYILVYCKGGKEQFKAIRNKIPADEASLEVYRNPNNDPKGRWRPIPMTAQAGHATPNQFYEIVTPTGKVHRPPEGRCWGIMESEYKKLLREGSSIGVSKRGRIWFGASGDSQPNTIRYLSEVEGFVPWTWWPHQEAGHTDEAKKEILDIFGEDAFPSPKPTRLIERIVRMYTNTDSNDIVLDSFAGSGTTGHAVLQLNKEDGGNRKFILIQIPYDTKDNEKGEFNICQRVTAKRLTRIINGYKFVGAVSKILLEEKIGMSTLKNPAPLLDLIESAKASAGKKFDDIETKCTDGVVSVVGVNSIKAKTEPLNGFFNYARLSEMSILGEYRDITKQPPSYDEIAKYIYYTETSIVWDKSQLDVKTRKIGQHGTTSLYLLYTPNQKDGQALDMAFLNSIAAKDKNPNIVIYCEKIWIHRSELLDWSAKHKKIIRPMIVPFNLK